MLNFFKRNKKKPDFPILNSYLNKDKYFFRIAEWFWHSKEQITIVDPNQPRVITLDDWPQLVFLAADGKKTIRQYVDQMADLYTSKIPEKLDETIIYQIEQLLKEGVIDFSENEINLGEKYLLPKHK